MKRARIIRAIVIAFGLALVAASVVTANVAPQAATRAGDRLSCAGYPERRVFLESQAWWMDTKSVRTSRQTPLKGIGGHLHVATCFPQDQHLGRGTNSGRYLHFDLRVMVHKGNAGTLRSISIALGPGGERLKRVILDRKCANGRVISTMCEWWVPVTIDTYQIPSGYQEIRFKTNVNQPNGEEMAATTGFNAWFHGGSKTYRKPAYLEARGWYDKGVGYTTASARTKIPTGTVSGVVRFTAVMEPGSGGIAVTHHSVHVDARFNADDFGRVLYDGSGPFRGTVSIDTRKLTNGTHCVALRADARHSSGGTNTGVLQFPLKVRNPGRPSGDGAGACSADTMPGHHATTTTA